MLEISFMELQLVLTITMVTRCTTIQENITTNYLMIIIQPSKRLTS